MTFNGNMTTRRKRILVNKENEKKTSKKRKSENETSVCSSSIKSNWRGPNNETVKEHHAITRDEKQSVPYQKAIEIGIETELVNQFSTLTIGEAGKMLELIEILTSLSNGGLYLRRQKRKFV